MRPIWKIKMFDQIETENTLHQIVSLSRNVIDHSEEGLAGILCCDQGNKLYKLPLPRQYYNH